MRPVSVAIPTAGQPGFLRCALESVRRQRALDRVEEILIAENLGDERSEAVCREFPDLPIRYVRHEPRLTAVQNYEYVIRESRAPIIAYLCDDDWWASSHVETALDDLESHPNAVARCSASYFVTSDALARGWVSRSAALWLAAGTPKFTALWELSAARVLAATWLLTPFHFSSMVLRRDAAVKAIAAVRDVHPYQADRLFFAKIVGDGDIVYEPLPDTYVRWRPNNATSRTLHDQREAEFRNCTALIWELSIQRGVDLVTAWREYLDNTDADVLFDLGTAFRRAMDNQTLEALGLAQFILPNRYTRAVRRVVRAGTSALAWRRR